MDDLNDSRRTRDDGIRYWIPRFVAIALGLLALGAGFWPQSRATVSFLADWSAFCIQAGAIYLFVFEREFLANLAIDFLDFIERMKAYRQRQLQKRVEKEERAKEARANSARPQATQKAPSVRQDSAEGSPSPIADPPISRSAAPSPPMSADERPEERPRFKSRDSALGLRVALGFVVVGLIGLLILNPLQQRDRQNPPVIVETVPSPPDMRPSAPDSTVPQEYTVREGESCWSLASRLAPERNSRVDRVWVDVVAANPEHCARSARHTLRPGTTLRIPAQPSQAVE